MANPQQPWASPSCLIYCDRVDRLYPNGNVLALNGVTLAPGKVVVNAGSPTVTKALERHGVETIQVDFSESHRYAIAGLHCATQGR